MLALLPGRLVPQEGGAIIHVGLDGCKGGWIASCRGQEAVFPNFADALRAYPRATFAVDMPIGLSEGDRACDKAARALLGPRRSSVFAPPSRAQLAAVRRPATLSAQSWGIVPRIREVDAAMTPRLQKRVMEAHPELAFAAFTGAPMKASKKTPAGVRERVRALGLLRAPAVPTGARVDDVLDAKALAIQARRIALGVATRLGGAKDSKGLRMEIWA